MKTTATAPARIGVQEVRRSLTSGAPTLLVCAYPGLKFDQVRLEGAIPLEELQARAGTLPKQAEIVFY